MGLSERAPIDRRRVGMTLIEVLITLSIVAVMATTVVLGLGMADSGADPQTEANRLGDRLGLAVDEVMVTRRPIALSWDKSGYGFVTRDMGGRWAPDSQAQLGPRHALPKGLTLAADAPILLPIGADGATAPARFYISGARTAWTLSFDGLNTRISPERGR